MIAAYRHNQSVAISPAKSLRQQQQEHMALSWYHPSKLLPRPLISAWHKLLDRGGHRHLLPCSERCNLSRLSTLTTFLLGYCVYRAVFSIKALTACEWVCRSGHCSHVSHLEHLPPSRRSQVAAVPLSVTRLGSNSPKAPTPFGPTGKALGGLMDLSLVIAIRALGIMAYVGAGLGGAQQVIHDLM